MIFLWPQNIHLAPVLTLLGYASPPVCLEAGDSQCCHLNYIQHWQNTSPLIIVSYQKIGSIVNTIQFCKYRDFEEIGVVITCSVILEEKSTCSEGLKNN